MLPINGGINIPDSDNESAFDMNKKCLYIYNSHPVPPPDVHKAFFWLPPLPDDFPDEAVLAMLKKAFPEKDGDELLRLEDHIRHNERTLLFVCGKDEINEILRILPKLPENLRIETGKTCKNPNPDLLPPLYDGQWRICDGCPHFTRTGHLGRCEKRWCCKFGASKPYEWDLDRDPMWYHPQCPRIARHFRFETAFLFYTERFEDDVNSREDRDRLFAERERLHRRDLAAAAEDGDLFRIRQRCVELGETFAEFAAKHDVFSRMLNYGEVNQRLVDNIRILNEEGIPVPPKWRKELLALSGEESLCRELRQLFWETGKK